jgi:hypothetical protein
MFAIGVLIDAGDNELSFFVEKERRKKSGRRRSI